ncbi:hypothetical protein IAD21_02076 [Abditibacteriota bacterium]|nr:hypothetical protein IAD21_02076 [Abditibacteriota bacterium]
MSKPLDDGDPMPDVEVIIFRFDGKKKKQLMRVTTDKYGRFVARLAPGQYSVRANNGYSDNEVKVRVFPEQMMFVTTNYDCGW